MSVAVAVVAIAVVALVVRVPVVQVGGRLAVFLRRQLFQKTDNEQNSRHPPSMAKTVYFSINFVLKDNTSVTGLCLLWVSLLCHRSVDIYTRVFSPVGIWGYQGVHVEYSSTSHQHHHDQHRHQTLT